MHVTPNPQQIAANERLLNDLIAALEKSPSNETPLVVEHLKSARTSILGGMPGEYATALAMCHDAAAALPKSGLRRDAQETLHRLRQEMNAAHPDPSEGALHPVHRRTPQTAGHPDSAAPEVWNFFGKPTSWLGTFHPTSFITITLPSLERAQATLRALYAGGFTEDEAIAVCPERMLAFFKELGDHRGTWAMLLTSLSRTLGTEQTFADSAVLHARDGAGFVLVYCPAESEAHEIRNIAFPFKPISMQRYLSGGVDGMIAQGPSPENHSEQSKSH